MDIIFSTEQNAMKQSIYQVALRFDLQKLKIQLEQKVAQKLKSIQELANKEDIVKLGTFKEKVITSRFHDLKKRDELIKIPDFKSEIDAIKIYNSSVKTTNHSEVSRT